jgi:adenylate kinase
LLDELGQQLDWAIWLDVPEDILLSRSIARSRPDDQPEIAQRRLDLFQERTIPMLEYYDYRHRLLKINGNQPPVEVEREILRALKVEFSV